MFWALLIAVFVFGGGTLAVAAWNYIRHKYNRKRYEPFALSEQRFRDRLPEGYLTVFLWMSIISLYYLVQRAWTAVNGPQPTTATPLVALVAVGIATFGLFVSLLSAAVGQRALKQSQLTAAPQMICYMTLVDNQIVIRVENASNSGAAYNVKALIGHEDPTAYEDRTTRFIGNDVMILEAPSFPAGRFYDFKTPNITQTAVQRGISIEVKVEWTAFNGQDFASSFVLKEPIAFQKPA